MSVYDSSSQPFFVFGAERSGTTVFRLMLDAHPKIGNVGEFDFLFDYIERDQSNSQNWVYDKESLNMDRIFLSQKFGSNIDHYDGLDLLFFMMRELGKKTEKPFFSINLHRNLEKIRSIFPDVRLIHLVRDPRDVARSVVRMGWAGNTYHGVDFWCEVEQSWNDEKKHMGPDQWVELKYEMLMADPESELRKICNFLGTSYDRKMLDYHKNSTYGPPDKSLAYQWKSKMKRDEVALIESKARRLMNERNYEVSGSPVPESKFLEGKLWVQNKIGIWSDGIKRFGLTVFLGEKIARHLRFRRLERLARIKMSAILHESMK